MRVSTFFMRGRVLGGPGLLLLLLWLATARAASWYAIVDSVKTARDDGVAMYQALDSPRGATVVVAVAIVVPTSLQSCTDLTLDLPLLRTWPTNNATAIRAPTALTLYQWRDTVAPPSGNWAAASRRSEPAQTIAAMPQPNLTWQPTRAWGVYRFQYKLARVLSGGQTVWLGLFFDQPLAVANANAVYWLGSASTLGTQPYAFIDVGGNFVTGGLTDFQLATANNTLPYTANRTPVTQLGFAALLSCVPIAGGPAPPPAFVALPLPGWDLVGARPSSPATAAAAPSMFPSPSPPPPLPPPSSPTPLPLVLTPASGLPRPPPSLPPPPPPSGLASPRPPPSGLASPIPPPPSMPSTPVDVTEVGGSTTSAEPLQSGGLNMMLLAGIGLAVVLSIVAIAIVGILLWRRRQRALRALFPAYAKVAGEDNPSSIQLEDAAVTTATPPTIVEPFQQVVLEESSGDGEDGAVEMDTHQ